MLNSKEKFAEALKKALAEVNTIDNRNEELTKFHLTRTSLCTT